MESCTITTFLELILDVLRSSSDITNLLTFPSDTTLKAVATVYWILDCRQGLEAIANGFQNGLKKKSRCESERGPDGIENEVYIDSEQGLDAIPNRVHRLKGIELLSWDIGYAVTDALSCAVKLLPQYGRPTESLIIVAYESRCSAPWGCTVVSTKRYTNSRIRSHRKDRHATVGTSPIAESYHWSRQRRKEIYAQKLGANCNTSNQFCIHLMNSGLRFGNSCSLLLTHQKGAVEALREIRDGVKKTVSF